MRSGELQAAASSVHEVTQALTLETTALRTEAVRAQTAMIAGDPVERAIADKVHEGAEVTIARLAEIKLEREETLEAVATAHRESRLKSEQMKSIVDHAAGVTASEAMRAAQATADDRFAARAWGHGKDRIDKG